MHEQFLPLGSTKPQTVAGAQNGAAGVENLHPQPEVVGRLEQGRDVHDLVALSSGPAAERARVVASPTVRSVPLKGDAATAGAAGLVIGADLVPITNADPLVELLRGIAIPARVVLSIAALRGIRALQVTTAYVTDQTLEESTDFSSRQNSG